MPDSDLEELDLDTWYELDIDPIEPPEDWTGAMDNIEPDDLGYEETGMTEADWAAPLKERSASRDEKNPDEPKDGKQD